jgi:hypothetical protein
MNYFILAKIGNVNMKKTFQKTLIASALAAASVGAFAGTAATTNLLFPYVSTATGTYTVLSISTGASAVAFSKLHFTYATKATSDANSVACQHLDGDATMTANDLMQFEMSKKVDLPTAFGDTTSVPKYFPSGAVGADRYGMLVVNNDTLANGTYGGAATYLNAPLYGEARIINTTSGLAVGYSTDDLHTTGAARPSFAAAAGPDGGGSVKVISWFQDPTVSTSWFIMPLGTETEIAFDANATQTYGVYNSGTQNVALAAWDAPTGVLGHFNNNEGFQSSLATTSVTCMGVVSRATLLGALNAPWSANGGWGVFDQSAAPSPVTATGSLIYKIESTTALGSTQSFITREPLL